MDDVKIVELYWARSESAIKETEIKYGKYCHAIAFSILHSKPDAEECVNDAYLKAWESIPPHRPSRLATFLGKLTRNISINRYVYEHAQKRHAATEMIFDEMAECIPDPATEAPPSDEIALKSAINGFLSTLTPKMRKIFVQRYWYMRTVREIAFDLHLTESAVKVGLHRTRNEMKLYLEKEGIVI